MSEPREVLCQLNALGATIAPAADRLLLRAGSEPVPASVIRRIREAKAGLLVLLRQEATAVMPGIARVVVFPDDEPGLEQPCASRRGRIVEIDRAFLHFCVRCGAFAPFGSGVSLRTGRVGRWFCARHRPGTSCSPGN